MLEKSCTANKTAPFRPPQTIIQPSKKPATAPHRSSMGNPPFMATNTPRRPPIPPPKKILHLFPI